jgi:hypothetical protein
MKLDMRARVRVVLRSAILPCLVAAAGGCSAELASETSPPDDTAGGEGAPAPTGGSSSPAGRPPTGDSAAGARVDVGADRTATGSSATLTARVTGAAAPAAGEWRVTAGDPRHVVFADRRAPETTVFFLIAGTYELTFTLAGGGARDALVVKVSGPSFTLLGRVLDDGKPSPASVDVYWHRAAGVVDTLRPGAQDGGIRLAAIVAPADELELRVRP